MLIVALAATVLLFSCSKKDDYKSNSIVGKWSFITDTIRVYINGSLYQTSASNGVGFYYEQFNADGTGSATDNTPFNYTRLRDSLTINTPSYSSGGVIVAASTQTSNIQTLSAHALKLYFEDIYVYSGMTTKTTEVAYFRR